MNTIKRPKQCKPEIDAVLSRIVDELSVKRFVEIKDVADPVRYHHNLYQAAYRRGLFLTFTRLDNSVFVRKP